MLQLMLLLLLEHVLPLILGRVAVAVVPLATHVVLNHDWSLRELGSLRGKSRLRRLLQYSLVILIALLGRDQRNLVGNVVKVSIDLSVDGRRIQETLLRLACWGVHAIHVELWIGDSFVDVHHSRLLTEILAAKILILGLRGCKLSLVLG